MSDSKVVKIVIIGAGSGFGAKLSCDILALPAIKNVEIALVDINADKLDRVARYIRRFATEHGLANARITASTERRDVLPGARYVVTAISVGGPAYSGFPANVEVEIPQKYGVEQSIADTIGVGGIFRFLRTAPVQLAVCRDMAELCPDALLLNYTNPMAMLTAMHSLGQPRVANVGLCHSVQGTAHQLAGYVGVPASEVDYLCAGINHQAWYLRLRRNGEDLYPLLRAKLDDAETVEKDTVRFEMFRHFGLFVTESTVHCSEYHPYFRRTPELMAEFGLKSRTIATEEPKVGERRGREWMADPDNAEIPPLKLSQEYAAMIIEAMETGTPYRFNGNVMNTGAALISNLPANACVEVPCLVDKQGVQPTRVGALPSQLAHLNLSNIAVQELAVQAALSHDRDAAFHACALDPLTRSVCSLNQIRAMFEELWAAESEAGLLW